MYTGQKLAGKGGLGCGGRTPLRTGWQYNPVDAFNNVAGTATSFGMGWTFSHDMAFIPFAGNRKRLVMPGGAYVHFFADPSSPGIFRSENTSHYRGMTARQIGTQSLPGGNSGEIWEVKARDGRTWRMEPYTTLDVRIFGGFPAFTTRITDRSGNQTVVQRSSNGRITAIEGAGGRRLELSYGTNGFVSRLQDHTGRAQTFDYNADDRISKITDQLGRVNEITYAEVPHYNNQPGNEAATACYSQTSLAHRRRVVVADPSRQYPYWRGIASMSKPGHDQPTRNIYNTDRVVSQTTASGQTFRFDYRRVGACVVKVADEAAKTWAFTCQAGQPLSQRTCPGGNCTEPMEGLCPEVDSEEAKAQGWRFYGGSNAQTTVTQPSGALITNRYDASGNVVQAIDELGQITRYRYNSDNRLTQVTDPLGRTSSYRYDTHGRRVGVERPLQRRADYAYNNAFERLSEVTRWLMGVPSVAPDGTPLSNTPLLSSFSYDAQGKLVRRQDPMGHVLTYEHNSAGQISRATAPYKVGTSAINILRDGQAATIAPSQRSQQMQYNAAGDISAVIDALSQTWSLGSDEIGRTTSVTDPLAYQQQISHNAVGQVTQITDELGQNSRREFDAAGRLTAVINAAGVAIERYEYDAQGRLTAVEDALGARTTTEYDSAGRVQAVTDRKGQRITVGYDARGQITALNTPNRSIAYTYDALGRMAEVRDASTTVAYRYDEAGRTIQVDTTTAAGSHRLEYEYDSLDRTTKRTLSGTGIPTPEVTSYQWDHANRLTEQKTLIGAAASAGANQAEHTTTYTYDQAMRLQSRTSQITAGGGAAQPALTQRYFYDEADRLTRIEYVQGASTASEQLLERIDYGYDARGQRTRKTTLNNHGTGQGETPMEATYDAANRMLSITLKPSADANTHSTWNLSYDANGNLIQKVNAANPNEKTLYTWDSENRLTGLSKTEGGQTTTASFQYDLFGRRISSTIQQGSNPPETVQFLYEGQQALGEIRSGSLSHRLITGLSLDETIARIAIAGTGATDIAASRQYLTDALNSVIAQANAQGGGIANSYGYSPYGETSAVGPDGTGNAAQYTSRENDGATGLYFYRARYYDPVLKRFISQDPIGLAGGENVFAYVEGNPVKYVDPSGERRTPPRRRELDTNDWKDLLDAVGDGIENVNEYLDLVDELKEKPACREICPTSPNSCPVPPSAPRFGGVTPMVSGCYVICYPEWK